MIKRFYALVVCGALVVSMVGCDTYQVILVIHLLIRIKAMENMTY